MATFCLRLLMYAPLVAAVPLSSFYPYGSEAGDSSLPPNDDQSSSEVSLPSSFSFFGILYPTLYVNNNGDITFRRAYNRFTPVAFPIQDENPMVAPFFTDIDTRGNGTVWYRATNDSTLLAKAARDIPSSLSDSDFSLSWLFIATWDHVGYYNGHADKTNTFQCILVSGGSQSFVIFLYANGLIQWTTADTAGGTGGLGGTPAQIGFNAGDGINYANVPGSRTSAVLNIASTSNVLVPGQWIYAVHAATISSLVPSSPLNFSLSAVPGSSNQLSASWSLPATGFRNITAYTVYCNTSASQAYPEQIVGSDTPSVRAVVDGGTFSVTFTTNLQLFTQYDCYVTANSSFGEGPPSTTAKNRTGESTPSEPPNFSLSSVFDAGDKLVASWAPPALKNGVITAYTIYCNTSDTQTYPELMVGPNAPTARSVVNGTTLTTTFSTGIRPLTVYSCFVTANTSVGEGPPSNVVSASTSEGGFDQCIPNGGKGPCPQVCITAPGGSFMCVCFACVNGLCINGSCVCTPSYTGQYCNQSRFDVNPCVNGGYCSGSSGLQCTCICPPNTRGVYCENTDVACTLSSHAASVLSTTIFRRRSLGIVSSIPAKDCAEIKSVRREATSGVYWILNATTGLVDLELCQY